ncbi:MAG TPA: DUF4148 domain-containing protein [Paraburkholderia sp.]|nr:DUF4148 domain-containing protein [Paraburkholderia sp.]
MKSLIKAVVIATVLAAPVVSFAQSSQGLTRAQVRAELIQLEKAGYNPATANDTTYPQDLQAAERRVEAQQAQAVAQAPAAKPAPAADTGYGSNAGGSSQAGAPATLNNQPGSVYFGH